MELFTARVQAVLTLILVGAFVALLVLKTEAADALKEFVGVAVMFWLLRQRSSNGGSSDPLQPEKKPDSPAPT